MGLIKAAFGAAGGVLADQWKEFFYCEAIPADVLAVKGKKKVTGRSSNTKGDDNIITNGSVIAVANGQCMLIVEQGQIVDMCAEPGEYTYDTSTEPSLFTGDLGESIKGVFQNIGKRFTFGGEAPKDQRVYYFNTKELTGNKYGTPSPVPFRVVDQRAAIDMDIGTHRQQVRHPQPRSLPGGGPAGGYRYGHRHPLFRRVQCPFDKPHAVLQKRLRQRHRGLQDRADRRADENGTPDRSPARLCQDFRHGHPLLRPPRPYPGAVRGPQ